MRLKKKKEKKEERGQDGRLYLIGKQMSHTFSIRKRLI